MMSTGTVNCSHCNALYQVIRAEAGPETTERDVACRVCGGPLPACEGQLVLTVCEAPMRRSRRANFVPVPSSLALLANDAAADASKQLASRSTNNASNKQINVASDGVI